MPPHENIESTLIWYKGTNYENYRQWTDALDKFLAIYKTPGVTSGRGQNIFNCKYNQPPPPGKVCDVNIKDFKKCTQENNYSYHKSSPCVFIKLNRIYGWVPQFYNRTNELPAKMPRQLKQKINETDPMEVMHHSHTLLKCLLIVKIVFCLNLAKHRLDIVWRGKSGRYWKYRSNRILSTSGLPRLLFPVWKFRRLP